eukprot:scaffold25624_cov99-Isochrysis_galbana.AAC.2
MLYKKPVVFSCSHSRVFTPPRPVEGPDELNFARVGGGRPDLDLAEGRGVGAGPSVSILDGGCQWESFWPIGPIEPGLEPTDPLAQATDGGAGANFCANIDTTTTPTQTQVLAAVDIPERVQASEYEYVHA